MPSEASQDFLSSDLLAHPWPSREAWAKTLDATFQLLLENLDSLPERRVSRSASPQEMASRFAGELPDEGCSPIDALHEWYDRAEPGIVRTPGPRYFGFVTGGVTPGALAGDLLASAIDQNPANWLLSPAAAQTEVTVVRWLLDMFGLPSTWTGVITSGATMSNLCGLAAARQWAARQMGFDAARDGLGGHPRIAVVGSTEVHQSALKSLASLGLGSHAMRIVPATAGVIDLTSFAQTVAEIDGPVIAIANAGEVNTGAFDHIRGMAKICAAHPAGAWLHVDGAFGLYAALSPEHQALLDGIELADSVATDAHKWLNVPYDSGVVFVKDSGPLVDAFGGTPAYLRSAESGTAWNAFEHLPEFSRRFRGLAAWCSLRSMGRSGYARIVRSSIANAQQFAAWVEKAAGLELLAPATLNIVCFRVNVSETDDGRNDHLTSAVLDHVQSNGLAYASATRWNGCGAIRAAFDNWATSPADVAALQEALQNAIRDVTDQSAT